MTRRALLAFFALASGAACAQASGDVKGGDALFDASAPKVTTSSEGDAGPDPTWNGLYRDFFGPSGKASCAGDGTCHGDASQPGAQASAWICNQDKDACYKSIRGDSGLVTDADVTNTDPTKLPFLLDIIRKDQPAGQNRMPKRPTTISFSIDDVARIKAWIKNGAKNDG